jgi:shikimate dehydrogenase
MTPTLLGVAGFPVAHSRSPAMHAAALEALGLDWRYLRLPVPPERFTETARALGGSGYRGINVTVPHKEAAAALADSASAAVTATGAANTLTYEDDGSVAADNTDAPGFLAALEADPAGLRVTVLGAGGSARGVAWALAGAGAEVSVWNRTAERAHQLAADLGVAAVERPGQADLLVNCTSVGLQPVELEDALAQLDMGGSAPPATVADLVYGQEATPVERWARAGGARFVSGLEVLVRQGALSLRRWTGLDPPLDVMRSAAGAHERT